MDLTPRDIMQLNELGREKLIASGLLTRVCTRTREGKGVDGERVFAVDFDDDGRGSIHSIMTSEEGALFFAPGVGYSEEIIKAHTQADEPPSEAEDDQVEGVDNTAEPA